MSAYCATKFAIRGLTQCAAMDYAKYGITANSYSPWRHESRLPFASQFSAYSLRDRLTYIPSTLVAGLDEYHTKITGQPKGSWTDSVRPL